MKSHRHLKNKSSKVNTQNLNSFFKGLNLLTDIDIFPKQKLIVIHRFF